MPDFPASRWARVGATPEEVEALSAEFDRSDIFAQDSLTASWASAPDDQLGEQLQALRDRGHFDPEEVIPVAEEPQETFSGIPVPITGPGTWATPEPVLEVPENDGPDGTVAEEPE